MQHYTREEWKSALTECGFDVTFIYDKDGSVIFEAAKKYTCPFSDNGVL